MRLFFSPREGSCNRLIQLCFLGGICAIAIFLWAKPRRDPRLNRLDLSEYTPVKNAFVELGFRFAEGSTRGGKLVTNFGALCTQISARYPEERVTPNEDVPFPDLLPSGRYSRLASWRAVTNVSSFPILWTEVHLPEEVILFLTLDGGIGIDHPHDFKKRLDRLGRLVEIDRRSDGSGGRQATVPVPSQK